MISISLPRAEVDSTSAMLSKLRLERRIKRRSYTCALADAVHMHMCVNTRASVFTSMVGRDAGIGTLAFVRKGGWISTCRRRSWPSFKMIRQDKRQSRSFRGRSIAPSLNLPGTAVVDHERKGKKGAETK